jgi:putative NADH-flavin reductase
MNLLIFGASGAIGIKLTQQALAKGHDVKAFVRNPDKIKISHPNLQIVKGDLSDKVAIQNSIKGSDVIVSVLSPPLVRNYEGMPLAEAHKNILSAMKDNNVKRLITLATPSVKFEKDQKSIATVLPGIMAKLFFP